MRSFPLPSLFPRIRLGIACVSIPLLVSCAATPGLESARDGKFAKLQKTLAKHDLDPGEVREIAQAVLSADVIGAKDREDRPFIRSLRLCASPLVDALRRRAEKEDGVGAEAALILLELGKWSENPSSYEEHEDGAWRALAARALKTRRGGKKRRHFFEDPDERVRRAALSAAIEAKDAKDRTALLEVSRLDPDPMSRSRAYQALGSLGGKSVMTALSDRFQAGDEAIRLAIVDAWGRPGLYDAGGRKRLSRLMSHDSGYVALHAASLLARDEDKSLRNRSLTRLETFTQEGTLGEKRLALRLLPGGRVETTRLLLKLRNDEDPEVAVIAWARLLGNKKVKSDARKALIEWAKSDAPVAYQARAALAATADESVHSLLARQVRDTDPGTRRVAGYGLLRLGAWNEMAQLLGDKDADVRRPVACRALGAPPRPRFKP